MDYMNDNEKALFGLLAIIVILAILVVLPVLEYVLVAIILAYVLYPLHVRFETLVGPFVSAIVLIATALVALIVPLVYILGVFASDLRAAAEGEPTVEIGEIEEQILERTGVEVDLVSSLSDFAEQLVSILFGGVTGILTTALEFFIGIALVLFLVFYLLRDGDAFVTWLEELSPLPVNDTKRLFRKVHQTMWGAVIGHSFAALVQALVAGVGLWIAGVPNPLFWTVVMAVLAFLPLIGAFLIWAPASGYLFLIDQTVAGVFLFLYGATIVSMIDYYARPLVIDQSARLNPGVILVGVFGGIYTFGFVGLFIGPIIIGVLAATLETIKEKQELSRAAAEQPPDSPVPDAAVEGSESTTPEPAQPENPNG